MKGRYSVNIRYVAIEGIDGSGKSSLAVRLTEWYREQGMSAVCFEYFERGDHSVGRFLKSTFYVEPLPLRARVLNAIPALKMTLFAVNAAGNWRRTVVDHRPLLVIGDRSIASLLLRFGEAFGGRRRREIAARLLNRLPLPTDILYLDIPPDLARRRLEDRGQPLEATETTEELAEFRFAYEDVFFRRPLWFCPRIHRLDASVPKRELMNAAISILSKTYSRG